MTDNEVNLLLWGLGALVMIHLGFASWIGSMMLRIADTIGKMDTRLTRIESVADRLGEDVKRLEAHEDERTRFNDPR